MNYPGNFTPLKLFNFREETHRKRDPRPDEGQEVERVRWTPQREAARGPHLTDPTRRMGPNIRPSLNPNKSDLPRLELETAKHIGLRVTCLAGFWGPQATWTRVAFRLFYLLSIVQSSLRFFVLSGK
jgi:hypothetical protein